LFLQIGTSRKRKGKEGVKKKKGKTRKEKKKERKRKANKSNRNRRGGGEIRETEESESGGKQTQRQISPEFIVVESRRKPLVVLCGCLLPSPDSLGSWDPGTDPLYLTRLCISLHHVVEPSI
jgi:hypothetical protein